MTKDKKVKQEDVISIPIPNRQLFHLKIRNTPGSSLLMNKFSISAEKQIIDKQMGKATIKKAPKNPDRCFEESQYRDKNGKLGIPANAVHASMMGVWEQANLPNKKTIRQNIRILGDIIPFTSNSEPRKHAQILKLPQGRGADWRIRSEIEEWEMEVPIYYDTNSVTLEQIINIIDLAGFHCGLLDNRPNSPKCSGTHGMYEVVKNGKGKNDK